MIKKTVFIGAMALLAAFSARAGVKEVGNGGDVAALEFVDIATQLLDYLNWIGSKEIDTTKFSWALENTKVESTSQELTLNRLPKDAINYPLEKKIIFNRDKWKSIGAEQRAALAFHEYLGILGIDDTGYKISKKILKDRLGGNFDRRLTAAELKKVLPQYITFIKSKAAVVPSAQDNDDLGMLANSLVRRTYRAFDGGNIIGHQTHTIQDLIEVMESSLKDIRQRTAKERQQEAQDLLSGFSDPNVAGRISCLLGYQGVSRFPDDRIVKCVDDRGMSGAESEDGEGSVDKRIFKLSIDAKNLAPVGVLSLSTEMAG
jgi:hypothetical protein